MAITDWYSRYVLIWALSTTLKANFCIEAPYETLPQGRCEIFNTANLTREAIQAALIYPADTIEDEKSIYLKDPV